VQPPRLQTAAPLANALKSKVVVHPLLYEAKSMAVMGLCGAENATGKGQLYQPWLKQLPFLLRKKKDYK